MKLYWKSTAPNEYMMFLQMTGFGPCVSPARSAQLQSPLFGEFYDAWLTIFRLQPLERQCHPHNADRRADGRPTLLPFWRKGHAMG